MRKCLHYATGRFRPGALPVPSPCWCVSKTVWRSWPQSHFSVEIQPFACPRHALGPTGLLSAALLQHLTPLLHPDRSGNLSLWPSCLQTLGTDLPVHMSAGITGEAVSGRRGVVQEDGSRLFVSPDQFLSTNPARLSETSHFFFCASVSLTT